MILALRSDKPEAELYLFNDGKKIAEIKGQTLFTGFLQNDLPEFLIFMIV